MQRRPSFLEGSNDSEDLGGRKATSGLDVYTAINDTASNRGEVGASRQKADLDDESHFWAELRGGLEDRLSRETAMRKAARQTFSVEEEGRVSLKGKRLLRSEALAERSKRERYRHFFIDPANPKKVAWDLWVGVLIVYSVVVVPWRIAYSVEPTGFTFYLEMGIDICFGIDIVLSFFTAYVADDVLVTSYRKIWPRYLRTWFLPDLLSTVPVDLIISRGGDAAKLVKVVRLFRLLKLMRILRLGRKMKNADTTQYINPAIIRLIKLIGKILFAAHLISCVWYLVNDCKQQEDDGIIDWLHCGGTSNASKYLASFYWTITTLMSVGYGDISADTNAERIFAIVTEIIGATAFGFIIAMVTVIVETVDPQATAKEEKMDEVREYMAEKQLCKDLQRKIRRHFDYQYSSVSVFREVPIVQDLPHSLRIKLAYETHKASIHKFHITSSLDVLSITEMVHRLKPMNTVAGETIIRANDILEECFFVDMGEVEAFSVDGRALSTLVGIFRTGSEFELASLVNAARCSLTYRTVTATALMWLDEDDINHLMGDYLSAERSILARITLQTNKLRDVLSSPITEWRQKPARSKLLLDWDVLTHEQMDAHIGAGDVTLNHLLPGNANEKGEKMVRSSLKEQAIVRTLRVEPRKGRDYIVMRMTEQASSRKLSSYSSEGKKLRGFLFGRPQRISESVETPQAVRSRGIILPSEKYKVRWDLYVGFLISLSVITVPYRLGFVDRPGKGWLITDSITDSCFFLDILLSFRTAYLDDNNAFVTVPWLIARKYAKGWLFIDIMSTVPFDRIAFAVSDGNAESGALRSFKLIRVLRLFRLVRLVKVFKVINVNGVADEMMELNMLFFRGLRLMLTLAFLGHLFGCFWSMVSIETMTAVESTWWGEIGLSENDVKSRYIASIYWAFTTMTTVGYGDIIPAMDSERAYATAIIVSGATVFGYIVGSVSSLASNPNGNQARETEKIIAVINYLEEKKVKPVLRVAVRKHIEYYIRRRSAFDESKILSLMPPNLRTAAILQGHRDIIHKLALFKHQTSSFIAFLVKRMMPLFIIAGNSIYSPEEGSDGIYFVLNGTAETYSLSEAGEISNSHLVDEGKFLGHDFFLGFSNVKLGARAVTDCSLFVLLENEMIRMVDRQPEAANQLQKALKRAIFEQETDPRADAAREILPDEKSPNRRISVMGLLSRMSASVQDNSGVPGSPGHAGSGRYSGGSKVVPSG